MTPLASTVMVASLIAHGLLLIYVQTQSQRLRVSHWWVLLAILFSLLSVIILLVPSSGAIDGYLVVLAQTILLIVYGALVLYDVTKRAPRAWLLGGGLWFAALIAAGVLTDASTLGRTDWLVNLFSAPNSLPILVVVGLLSGGLALLTTIFYAFYKALLPEVANRALYWAVNAAILLIASTLLISKSELLILIGQPIVLIGLIGAVYAQVSYRVIDIRGQFGPALRITLQLILATIVIFIVLSATNLLETRSPLIFAGLALLTAILYTPLRLLTEALISRVLRGSLLSPTEITRRYSREISGSFELPTLIDNATRAINTLFQVRRSALILVNDSSSERAELKLFSGDARSGVISKSGMLYRQLAIDGKCVSQFDLEFNPAYKGVPASESSTFRETQMSVYAPIVFENALIGILACGQKLSDAPFSARDLELLTTLAHQTGAALRNARLVADLRTLNASMTSLNSSLEGAKEQMERLELG